VNTSTLMNLYPTACSLPLEYLALGFASGILSLLPASAAAGSATHRGGRSP
jgi:hypothetical protein